MEIYTFPNHKRGQSYIFSSPEGPNMEDWGGEESDGLPPKLFMLEPACKFSFTILKFISETEMQDSVTIQM